LWVKPANLTLRRLMPESESTFYDSEIPDLRLRFIKDGNGNVTGLTLNDGQANVLVRKLPQ
jgi:hypothetical protein